MTALIGAAVLGLVPLPSMATSDTWGSTCEHRPNEAANPAHRAFLPRASIERLATREELERLRRELGGIGAETTRSGLRRAGTSRGRAECSC